MREIDLHIHTTASDGTLTPEQAVALAAQKGLRAIAVSDHDTIEGCAKAVAEGQRLGVEVVPGIELSTKFLRAVHILGYYTDMENPELGALLRWIVEDRDNRNRYVAELMAADGLPVSYEQMHRRFGAVIGRPHFGQVLVELGLAESVNDAFDRYIEKGQKYYAPRTMLAIEQAVQSIVTAGGIAALAHPFQYRFDDEQLRRLIEHCMDNGLSAIECRYSGYSREQTAYLEALAEEYGLLKTGGSDFHGQNKPHIDMGSGCGQLAVPYSWLERLREAAGS